MEQSEMYGDCYLRFFVPSGDDLQLILGRIARIIDQNGQLHKIDGESRYMIGDSNDWWLSSFKNDSLNEIVVTRRLPNKELMFSLRKVIIFFLDIEHFNR